MSTSANDNRPRMNPYWAQPEFAAEGFRPNPQAGVHKEFKRLAKVMGWTDEERRYRQGEAYESEFNFHYPDGGSDRLSTWRELCREVGIDPIPVSITQCKETLKGVYINLVNLINHRRNKHPLMKFPNYHAFLNYTRNGRTFPKEQAKAEGFIKIFLREVYGVTSRSRRSNDMDGLAEAMVGVRI